LNRHGRPHVDENWDVIFEKATETLLAVTLGWRNVTNGSGEEIPFSPEAARAIYENRRSSVRAQLLTENQRIAGFSSNSASS
jgi:hypothetical protein